MTMMMMIRSTTTTMTMMTITKMTTFRSICTTRRPTTATAVSSIFFFRVRPPPQKQQHAVGILSSQSHLLLLQQQPPSLLSQGASIALFSNHSTNTSTNNSNSTNNTTSSSASSNELLPLTPGEKVIVTTRLFFYTGALAFASICAYYIGKELLPTKMSPNTIFDNATKVLRQNSEIQSRFGSSLKFYGKDHGGHREGRRNFIEHTEYMDPYDGSKRMRVRFNLEGGNNNAGAAAGAHVYAEVSNQMPYGEFVYLLVQDKRNGMVITIIDRRSELLAKQMAGGKESGQEVLRQLLLGDKKK